MPSMKHKSATTHSQPTRPVGSHHSPQIALESMLPSFLGIVETRRFLLFDWQFFLLIQTNWSKLKTQDLDDALRELRKYETKFPFLSHQMEHAS